MAWRCLIFSGKASFLALKVNFCFTQVKLQKHQAFEAEISAHTNTIITIKTTGEQMITEEHYESVTIRVQKY